MSKIGLLTKGSKAVVSLTFSFHRTGAAQIRSQVSVAFSSVDGAGGAGGRALLSSNSFPSGQGSGALLVQSLGPPSLSPPTHLVLVS